MDANPEPKSDLREKVIEVIRQVYDPEIPVNIYDIGLIYGVEVDPAGAVKITMTLTSPSCPSAEAIPVEVEERVKTLAGVTSTKVDLVWEPPGLRRRCPRRRSSCSGSGGEVLRGVPRGPLD